MYLTFSNLNSIHWIIKKKRYRPLCTFQDISVTCFSTDSRHTYGYKLCSSSRRFVPFFVFGRLHTGASEEKRIL